MKLGFFDSGLGGLLMMESCKKVFPKYNYVFTGDIKNIPYGPRTSEEIFMYMEPYVLYLLNTVHCDYVCIACNTASVKGLPLFIKKYPQYVHRIIDIVEPTIHFLSNNYQENNILLVLATQGTVSSGVYTSIKNKIITQIPMPGLVNLIELNKKHEAIEMVKDAISYHNTSLVLLGCTHYIWLVRVLEKEFPHITFIGQNIILEKIFNNLEQIYENTEEGSSSYYVSGDHEGYTQRYSFPFKKLEL